ncbi:MAG: LysR family transcriptional regulator [Rubrivivax sp.]|nr:LysR family transcriptional regulator [Rubrivivax sp.]
MRRRSAPRSPARWPPARGCRSRRGGARQRRRRPTCTATIRRSERFGVRPGRAGAACEPRGFPVSAGDLRLPSIDALRAFEAAARLGSFERAADELAVTASAVSKRIAALEDLLGSPLFVRGAGAAKALALTAAGREYLHSAGQALALLAAMPQHRRTQQRLRRLRVVAPPTFARELLVPRLAGFTAAHPDIELELVLSIPFLQAAPADADVEVRHGESTGERVLLHDLVLPMAAPALLARLPPLREPADLATAPLLRTPLEPWTPWFRAAGLDWPEPAAGPKLVDLGLTLEAAVAGQGVALGRPTLGHRWLAAGSLQPLFGVQAAPARRYHLAPHAAGGDAALFADWLAAACADLERAARALLALPSGGT